MRNYEKLRGMRWTSTSVNGNFVLTAFGGSDEQLLEHILIQEAGVRSLTGPTTVFHRTSPVVLWFELNSENFGFFANFNATALWEKSRLGNDPLNGTEFYEMTKVQAQGSPRKVWSHGH